ncbi:MAG: glycosyltransferase family 4 protein [Candidatus Bathyarchaeia archaeon]
MSAQCSCAKVGIALTDTMISGTARRVANLFCALSQRHPSRYHFLVSEEIYQGLNRAKYNLGNYPNVHRLKAKSLLDRKRWEGNALTLEDAGRLLTLLRFRNQIARIVKSEGLRVIQAHNDGVYILGIHPIPKVVQIASLASIERRNYDQRSFFGKLLQFCLRNYHLIDCLCPQIQEFLMQNRVPEHKIFCAPNSFVDTKRYRPEPKDPSSVVFATRLHKFKGPDYFLDAVDRVYSQHPQVKFHLLGAGPLGEHVASRVNGVRSRISIQYAFMWDTSQVLNKSSISLQLQQVDNYPSQSLLEGMAAGNAIIATDVGQTRRLVDSSNGILVPLSNARALADAMIWMLKHPEKTSAMGRRSRERVLRRHTIANYLTYVDGLHMRAGVLAKNLNGE